MLHFLLSPILSEGQVIILASLIAFLLTFLMLKRPFPFLPRDHGRAYAINGALSKGKLRGIGLVLTAAYAVISVLILHSTVEYLIYCVLIILIMLSGYFDDAAETPWSDYKKGFIDLIPYNAFYDGQNIIWYDQEFTVDNCPLSYIMFRAVTYTWLHIPEAETVIPKNDMMERYRVLGHMEEYVMRENAFTGSNRNRELFSQVYTWAWGNLPYRKGLVIGTCGNNSGIYLGFLLITKNET